MTRGIEIGEEVVVGNGDFNIIAGPCSVESEEQIDLIARELKKNDIKLLRGGAFKPRTSPESFQGLGFEGFRLLKEMRDCYGLYIVSEIMDARDLEEADECVDVFQVGTRNMYNYSLLKELGQTNKPILFKRGMSATIEEWIKASEYIRYGGNDNIIMCERGIRTFETYTRNTLDLMTVPIIHNETDLPIIIDPSHGTGRKELVEPASIAAKAIGADGVMIEVHPDPNKAKSDGEQSLTFDEFNNLLEKLNNYR